VPTSELAKRVGFALVGVPVVLAAIAAGGVWLGIGLAAVAGTAAWEFFRLARHGGYDPMEAPGIALAAALPLVAYAQYMGWLRPTATWLALLVLGVLAMGVWLRGPMRKPIGATAVTLTGILYAGGMLSFAFGLRYQNYAVTEAAGASLLLLPVLLTWTSDTGAYFVGRAMGRHPLIPSVSPKKTIEGAIGALALCALASVAYVRWVLIPVAQLGLTVGTALLFGLIVSAAVQTGDLVESLIKRESGLKDSSHLFPGHGGVLDRIDGLLFALPVAYWLFSLPRVLFLVPR